MKKPKGEKRHSLFRDCDTCKRPLLYEMAFLHFVDRETRKFPQEGAYFDSEYICHLCPKPGFSLPFSEAYQWALEEEQYGELPIWSADNWGHGNAVAEIAGWALLRVVRASVDRIRLTNARRYLARMIAPVVRARIMERDNFRCRRCGVGPEDDRLEIDHIVPVARGGSSSESNLQTLCSLCNSGKTDHLPHAHDFNGLVGADEMVALGLVPKELAG